MTGSDLTLYSGIGRLPSQYNDMVRHADYVVYSYATPIAWRNGDDGLWFMPDERYSVTTTRHQSLIRAAVKPLNERTVQHGKTAADTN